MKLQGLTINVKYSETFVCDDFFFENFKTLYSGHLLMADTFFQEP